MSPGKKKWKRIQRWIAYYFGLLPWMVILSRLPLPVARGLGDVAGFIGWLVAIPPRRIAMENLRHAYGTDKSPRELRRICRRSFRHNARILLESMVISRWPAEKLDRVFGLREGFQGLRDLTQVGTVGITAHLGNWEVFGVFFGRYHPGVMTVGASEHSNPYLHRRIERFRSGVGLSTIYSNESPRKVLRVLKGGGLMAFLPDIDPRTPNGIFVPFFGRPAYTTTVPVNLARSTKSPMHLVMLVREGKGYRLVTHFHFQGEWTEDREGDIRRNTEKMTRLIEEEIRKAPEQWPWFHRRWRIRPGEEKRYDTPRWKRGRDRVGSSEG